MSILDVLRTNRLALIDELRRGLAAVTLDYAMRVIDEGESVRRREKVIAAMEERGLDDARVIAQLDVIRMAARVDEMDREAGIISLPGEME